MQYMRRYRGPETFFIYQRISWSVVRTSVEPQFDPLVALFLEGGPYQDVYANLVIFQGWGS